jgi:hypothetical protein
LIANALPVVETLTHIRARAYAALGLSIQAIKAIHNGIAITVYESFAI